MVNSGDFELLILTECQWTHTLTNSSRQSECSPTRVKSVKKSQNLSQGWNDAVCLDENFILNLGSKRLGLDPLWVVTSDYVINLTKVSSVHYCTHRWNCQGRRRGGKVFIIIILKKLSIKYVFNTWLFLLWREVW